VGVQRGDDRPIGVFDSGVGGLTVLRAVRERLPHEHAVYLGDTARVPYGSKSAEVVTRYSLRNAGFLLEQGIKLLVVACNTATAFALPELQHTLKIPVVGVVEPGAAAAAQRTQNGRVGVIGTAGTVSSGAYQRALARLAPQAQVTAQACPLFVPLAEEGWLTGEVPRRVAETYLAPLIQARVDTLVLGCTHYPLLKEVIADVMGPGAQLVDSAEATAEVVAQRLAELGAQGAPESQGAARYFVTDSAERFAEVASRFLGAPIPGAQHVDISSLDPRERSYG
jgi:glutamate racemase